MKKLIEQLEQMERHEGGPVPEGMGVARVARIDGGGKIMLMKLLPCEENGHRDDMYGVALQPPGAQHEVNFAIPLDGLMSLVTMLQQDIAEEAKARGIEL